MNAKKILGTVLCGAIAITALTGCTGGAGGSGSAGGKAKVGVSMPTKDLQRWNQDGDNMKKELEAAGYDVDLQYANNDVATQLSQVENMINSGCKVLVIAAIEGSSLGTALDKAEAKNIPVIAYDRLLMDNAGVDYYATFDNYMVGTIQAAGVPKDEEKLRYYILLDELN